jgi:2-methylcitrate dehydratase PrpD
LQLTEKRVSDVDVLALAKKVTVRTDDTLNSIYPEKTSSRVEITMQGGAQLVNQIDVPKGDPRDPMEAVDIAEKVRRFAGAREMSHINSLIDTVLDLEHIDDIGTFISRI